MSRKPTRPTRERKPPPPKEDAASNPAADRLEGLQAWFEQHPRASCALEHMLAMSKQHGKEALWAHARAARLSQLMADSSDINHTRTLSEAADRASNTFRRLMTALDEHRRPSAKTSRPTTFAQTNIAGQQIIQNNLSANSAAVPKNPSNELGYDHAARQLSADTQGLPIDAGRTTVSAGSRATEPAVGKSDRPENHDGQGSFEDECDETR